MYFKRKTYDKLLEWKQKYADNYAVLIQGARRVGKSTLVEQFAKNEYKSYALIDFANASNNILNCFDDISNPDIFFLRLQTELGITLPKKESVIIFDEVQLFPKARQAIKYLIKDGRYHYIETGSLISIKKNVKDILIPSEEMKINMYPLDYEEFLLATGNDTYNTLRELYLQEAPIEQTGRKLMRDFRLYMAVGGMPTAVKAYVQGEDFANIDKVKREIISLYEDDFRKIDSSGKIAMIFHSIPAQLAKNRKRFTISAATGRRTVAGDTELLQDLIDSRTVNISYNTTDPRVSLSSTKNLNSYKLYLADTGLFVTLMFIDRPITENDIYAKLLSDKLPANLGYLYENVVAQIIAASNRELYYHTWEKQGSTHYYETDFLISEGTKVSVIEVKSSGTGKHESLNEFAKKYSNSIGEKYIFSQKDIKRLEGNKYVPFYLCPFVVEDKYN